MENTTSFAVDNALRGELLVHAESALDTVKVTFSKMIANVNKEADDYTSEMQEREQAALAMLAFL